MIEALRGISFVSQKVKISKEVYYGLHPNPPNSGIIAFDRFLIKLKAEKNSFYACVISNYVRVKKVCIFEGSEHQILLEFYEGNQKAEKTFPCSILEPKEIKTLLSCGILYDSYYTKDLVTFLMYDMQKAPTVHYYHRLGWANNSENLMFFLHKPIGKNSDSFQNWVYDGSMDISPKGSLSAWTKMVKEQVINSIPLTFVLTLGFASSILALLNERYELASMVFNLSNFSSKGKTTALMLATSVTSCPKLNKGTMKSFFATDNAISEIVSNCNGITVALDEVALSGTKAFNRLLYALCSGASKLKLNGDSTLKNVREYSSVVITSAEFDILNEDTPEGLVARVFEITDDLTTSSRNSDIIKSTVLANHSLAGEQFLENLINYGSDKLYKLYDRAVEKLQKAVKAKGGLRDRIVSKLAVVWVTEHLMNRWLEFGIDNKEFTAYIVKLINASVTKVSPEEKLLNIIREEITTNKSRFSFNGNSSFGGCIGKINEHKGYIDVFIAQIEFKTIMKRLNVLNYAKTLKKLKDNGILIAEGDRLTRRVKLGATRVVCYCFRIDETDDSSNGSNSTLDI